eukprot:scaffold5246_cov105-Isochrysis_galbana.AAC.4
MNNRGPWRGDASQWKLRHGLPPKPRSHGARPTSRAPQPSSSPLRTRGQLPYFGHASHLPRLGTRRAPLLLAPTDVTPYSPGSKSWRRWKWPPIQTRNRPSTSACGWERPGRWVSKGARGAWAI